MQASVLIIAIGLVLFVFFFVWLIRQARKELLKGSPTDKINLRTGTIKQLRKKYGNI